MPYYPKSQIKSNLYTDGDKFSLFRPSPSSPQIPYTGYYYEISNGKRFTGPVPSQNSFQNLPLYLLTNPENNTPTNQTPIITYFDSVESDPLVDEYVKLRKDFTLSKRYLPLYNPNIPTQKNYSAGMYTRYFCKRGNEFSYIEISGQDFSKLNLKDPQIAWDLYTAKSLVWYIKGDKEKIYNTNRNLTMLFEQKEKWPGFSQYLKENYLKYYLES
jgi:hypothetical protein